MEVEYCSYHDNQKLACLAAMDIVTPSETGDNECLIYC